MSYAPMTKGRRPRLSRRSRDLMDGRIEQARRALAAHAEPTQDYAAVDMICNLLHHLREEFGMPPERALEAAMHHYEEEIAGRD